MRGDYEVYVWQRSSTAQAEGIQLGHADDICLIDLGTTGGGGATCGAPSEVAERGIVMLHRAAASTSGVGVGMLVPDGVQSVRITDSSGASHEAKVTNNVAEVEDGSIASISYTLPDGVQRVDNIAQVARGATPE